MTEPFDTFLQAAVDEYAGQQVLTAIAPLNRQITDLTGQLTTAQATITDLRSQLAAVKPPPGPPLPAGWSKVTLFDDFTGPLNPAVWSVVDKAGYARDSAWLTKEQVTVRDSCLVITAANLTTPVNGRTVTSGAVSSKATPGFWQRGGRFEAKIALPTAAALWSAFWLRNDPAVGELDILEAVGATSPIVQTAHQDTSGTLDHLGFDWKPPTGWQRSDFHVYAIEWDPEQGNVRWFVDGQQTRAVSPSTVGYPSGKPAAWLTSPAYANPMAILLNLQVGGKFSAYYGSQVLNPAQLDGSARAQLRVDWVRVLTR